MYANVTDLELDGSEVTRDNFPLPVIGPKLRDCAFDIHRGSGVCIVRGLMPTAYSVEENAIVFLGLASHIGGQRGVQTSKGAMLSKQTYQTKLSRDGAEQPKHMCTSPVLGRPRVKGVMGFTQTAAWYRIFRCPHDIVFDNYADVHEQPFHNDMGCEILAIHVRDCAAQGGGTYVASAAAVYNAMMKANPWVVHTLAKHNWPVQV